MEQEQRLGPPSIPVATKQDIPSSPEAEDAVVEASATSCFERVVRSQIEFWTLNIHTRDGEDAQDADSQVGLQELEAPNQGQEETQQILASPTRPFALAQLLSKLEFRAFLQN